MSDFTLDQITILTELANQMLADKVDADARQSTIDSIEKINNEAVIVTPDVPAPDGAIVETLMNPAEAPDVP